MSEKSNIFLFQTYLGEILREGKRVIKSQQFKCLDPDGLLQRERHQRLDVFMQYIIQGLKHPRTREHTCTHLDSILRQSLADKEFLPAGLTVSILSACSTVPGDSSTGSSVGSLSNLTPSTMALPPLLLSLLLHTSPPIEECVLALNALLEGTRKKQTALLCTTLLRQAYDGLLQRTTTPSLHSFVTKYFATLLDQVQAHSKLLLPTAPKIATQGPVVYHQTGTAYNFGKYGKCMQCRTEAQHFSKDESLPVCSMECKKKIHSLIQDCKYKDAFDIGIWLIDSLPLNDPITYQLLCRHLPHLKLTHQQLLTIVETAVSSIANVELAESLLTIVLQLLTNPQKYLKIGQVQQLPPQYLKVFFMQLIHHISQLPISAQYMSYVQKPLQLFWKSAVMEQMYVMYDSKLMEQSIVSEFMNVCSFYVVQFPKLLLKDMHRVVRDLFSRHCPPNTSTPVAKILQGGEELVLKRQMEKCITIFNTKPKLGIQAMHALFQQHIQLSVSPIKKEHKQGIQNIDSNSSAGIAFIREEKQECLDVRQVLCMDESLVEKQTIQVQEQQSNKKQVQVGKQQQSLEIVKQQLVLTPNHIALYLWQNIQNGANSKLACSKFLKQKVGEYFGSSSDEAKQVCKCFLALFNFDKLLLDDCLRLVLNKFSLPKQTQQIQRIIGVLSTHLLPYFCYLKSDTGLFQYIYILMMLQTNQNPNVCEKDKLKITDVLSMCKYVDGGVDPDLVTRDYHRIVQHPLNIPLLFSPLHYFTKKHPSTSISLQSMLLRRNSAPAQTITQQLLLSVFGSLQRCIANGVSRLGLLECALLYGRFGHSGAQQTFLKILQKASEEGEEESVKQIVQIGTYYGNYLYFWQHVAKVLFRGEYRDEQSTDKLLVHSADIVPERLLTFVQALLTFSGADLTMDGGYQRELFVLRHITELLEYNLQRMKELWRELWPTLAPYFKQICLHPDRRVAMAAIDTYKQLSLKLFKLKEGQGLPVAAHASIMSTYCYVFEQSATALKDLIVNMLLNLISADVMSGWEAVYRILQLWDAGDKRLSIHIYTRLFREVGLAVLPALTRLHSLLVRQLRMSDIASIPLFLPLLQEITKCIHEPALWIWTIQGVKDVFKSTESKSLLTYIFSFCNHCLSVVDSRQLYDQVADLLFYATDRTERVLIDLMEEFCELNTAFVGQYLGDSFGFLWLFDLLLSSVNKIVFAFCLKEYLNNYLLVGLGRGSARGLVEEWVVNKYMDSLPIDLFNLRQSDSDFVVELQDIVKMQSNLMHDNELVQFHLSSQQFTEKNMVHLLLFSVALHIYQGNPNTLLISKLQDAFAESYEFAYKVNCLLPMRYFLWNNNFLNSNDFPGQHKQQHRTLEAILMHFPMHKAIPYALKFLRRYIRMHTLLSKLKQIYNNIISSNSSNSINGSNNSKSAEGDKGNKKKSKSKPSDRDEEEMSKKKMQIYIADTEQWIKSSQSNVKGALQRCRDTCQQDRNEFYQLCLQLLNIKQLSRIIVRSACQILNTIYGGMLQSYQ